MVAVDDWLQASDLDALMIMQVHDELVFEVAEHQVDALQSALPGLMSGVTSLDVPLVVEVGVGSNWDEAH